jgi:hypothetical protein
MDKKREAIKGAREAYEKPELRKVKLVAGEVAAAGCKTMTSVMGPTTGCFTSMCVTIAS